MNARYSPIAPVHLLYDLIDRDLATGHFLLLAHDVLAHTEEYHRLGEIMREKYGDDLFIIMDNSVVELGHAIEFEKVLEAADIVEADCVMTPDVLGSKDRTLQLIGKHLPHLLGCSYPLMKVPQGASLNDIEDCATELAESLPWNYWGVPRWIANKLDTRDLICRHIKRIDPDAQIHLLGMSKHLEDDLRCTQLDGVIGIDSANPLVMGHLLKGFGGNYKHYDRGDYWERTTVNQYIITNMMFMNKNVGYPQT